MRRSAVIVALVLMDSVASARPVPLPRPRPATTQPAAVPTGTSVSVVAEPSACRLSLAAFAMFTAEPPVNGAGECGIEDPVRLEAVILADNTRVAINPPAMLRCNMAAAVARWVRETMASTVARLGSALRGIENFDSYSCRGRNRVFGAKMSEHGRGNALDIRGLRLASGTMAHLTDPHVAKAVRNDLRADACGRFTTVLGPGSDGYHENHVHVDLAERRNNYRLCQWEVREPSDVPLKLAPDEPVGSVAETIPLPRRRP